IGVVGGSFGFQELIKKVGVERRLYTAGEHKAMLDPFLPENPDDVARLKAIQREIHAIFIALVKESRRDRLGEKVLTPLIAPASGMLSGLFGRRSPGAGALAAMETASGWPDEIISA